MKLMIIDGNSIVNRAFFGVRPLNAPDGTPTNAIFGFINILTKLLDEIKPDGVSVAFDLKAPTFRHKAYDDYKATRGPMPEDLAVQIPLLKEVLDDMNIRRYELEGYEADDILGTAARICGEKGWQCVVVTGDKDSLQLVSSDTTVCNVKTRMGQQETIMYTPQRFEEEYGFAPERMVDLKALMGDSSDNIPGVHGIGEKTAKSLLEKFGSLENIYSDIENSDIKENLRQKLITGKEDAEKSYWLATILREVPIEFEPEDNLWNYNYSPKLFDLFKRLGFNKFIEKWNLKPSQGDSIQRDEAIFECDVNIIETSDKLSSVIDGLRGKTLAVYCTDELEFVCFGYCDNGNNIAYYLCEENYVNQDEYAALLKAFFSSDIHKIGHGIKDIFNALMAKDIPIINWDFDTALGAYLLDATAGGYEIPTLTMKYFGSEPWQAPAEESGQLNILDVAGASELMAQRGAYAIAIYKLKAIIEDKLNELKMDRLYYEIELPLCKVLADMERRGFYVDRDALFTFGESLNRGISDLQSRIWEYAGHEFNISSPKQLGQVLFEELMLPAGKKTKTGWSTGADILEKLKGKHPIVECVLDYRELTKLKSTYADGLLKVIAPDGRIHTNFQMTVTATGRLSSTEPNLQNIPVRKELGAQVREMFVASEGMVLVDADYSQIELRLLAHISGDEAMEEAFLSGEDFHAVTASNVFNVPLDEVTPTLRSRAKAVNFGIVYGISAYSLSQDIGVYVNEAQRYIDTYMKKYSGVKAYLDNVVSEAEKNQYVSTIYGRRRYLPELKSSNFNTRSFGKRVALNMPIQGTAADIIKLAMVNVFNRLEKENLKGRLILQVHDELIAECPVEEAQRVERILKEEMENVAKLAVPLLVETNVGKSWAEAH